MCPRNWISSCRLQVERGRAGVVSWSAVALSASECRPRRVERCVDLRAPGLMNGKSVTVKTQARGFTHHPDVRALSLGRLLQRVSLCIQVSMLKRVIFDPIRV